MCHPTLCEEGGGAHPSAPEGVAEAVRVLGAAIEQSRPASEGTQVGIGSGACGANLLHPRPDCRASDTSSPAPTRARPIDGMGLGMRGLTASVLGKMETVASKAPHSREHARVLPP